MKKVHKFFVNTLPCMMILLICFLLGACVGRLEEPEYQVLKTYENSELRNYKPYLVAELTVQNTFENAGNEAFNPLADYIFGNNLVDEKMSMTTPVEQNRSGEKIGMTTPVEQEVSADNADRYKIRFVLPKRYTIESIPKPKDPRIILRLEAERNVLVRRYSGAWSKSNYEQELATLLSDARRHKYQILGEPIWARYNSPYSLWFMRRNEIWLTVKPQ